MRFIHLVILLLLAISVLLTYYIYLIKDSNKSYIDHPFWFDLNKDVISILMIFQILAMIGFIVSITSWIIRPPKKGIMKGINLFLTIVLFLGSAIMWPIATHYNCVSLSVFNLILTAIASILLLAGSIEEEDVQWYRVMGLLFLCITTVLGDGVIWNANYIIKNKSSEIM
jgi:hypothetical protein